jgi:hypothetical protein
MPVCHGGLHYSQSPGGFFIGVSELRCACAYSSLHGWDKTQTDRHPSFFCQGQRTTSCLDTRPEPSHLHETPDFRIKQVPIDDLELPLGCGDYGVFLAGVDLTLFTWGTPVLLLRDGALSARGPADLPRASRAQNDSPRTHQRGYRGRWRLTHLWPTRTSQPCSICTFKTPLQSSLRNPMPTPPHATHADYNKLQRVHGHAACFHTGSSVHGISCLLYLVVYPKLPKRTPHCPG